MDSERELIYDTKSGRAGQPIEGQKEEKVEGKGRVRTIGRRSGRRCQTGGKG